MPAELTRYAKIYEKFPREFLLLQGKGCIWKKCRFCDYYDDVSANPYTVNRSVLHQVTGEFGVLDVINSGSVFELDEQTLNLLSETVKRRNIHTLWFESHWLYHKRLDEIRAHFPNVQVKFRIGAETFDPLVRTAWKKGIPNEIGAAEMAEYFDGCCLLICVQGQTKDMILRDIELADRYFEYASLNVFVENTTDVKRDADLVDWFVTDVYPTMKAHPKFEILLNNIDLGVG